MLINLARASMTIDELRMLVQIADDIGARRVVFDDGRDGQVSYTDISATIKTVGPQMDQEKLIIFKAG